MTNHEARERILSEAVERAKKIPAANLELHAYASEEAAKDAEYIRSGGLL
jgi:hypothetical protein